VKTSRLALGVAAAAVAIVAAGTGMACTARRPEPRVSDVTTQDIQIPVHGWSTVAASVVRPAGEAAPRSRAAVLFLHWYAPGDSTQNRTEFHDEAVTLAQRGVVSVLPDLTFPWSGQVSGDVRDADAVQVQLNAIAEAYRALLAQPGVDPDRTAVVGHDYGAMYASMLAHDTDGIKALVFMAGDAKWSNWFSLYFKGPADFAVYNKLFDGLDPVDNVARDGLATYFQWAGADRFVPDTTRAAFATAAPQAKVSLYPHVGHQLSDDARTDRIAWITAQLGI
jgi:dienelactone hydrolase